MKRLLVSSRRVRALTIAALLPLTIVVFSSMCMPSRSYANDLPPSHVLIEHAYHSGRIDFELAQLYKAYTIYDRSLLPEEFRSPTPGKCGTAILIELRRNFELLSTETQKVLSNYPIVSSDIHPRSQDRPTLSGAELTASSTNFIAHYTTSGEDAVPTDDSNPANGIPDFVDNILQEMETVWSTEISTLGWLQPPADTGEGGDTRYDIYLEESGYYGYCSGWGGLVGDNPNSPSVIETNASYSYLSMDNDFAGFPNTPLQNIQVTGAHEFNHAIQFGYDGDEMAIFLWEGIATWMEDNVYDDVNDNLQYLNDPDGIFQVPDTCLPNNYLYSTWIFFRYISEHHGGQTTVRSIWENAVTSDGLDALSTAISGAGSDLATVFPRSATANLLLSVCPQNTPYCYEEADLYKTSTTLDIEGTMNYTGSTVNYTPTDGVTDNYSADYIVLNASGIIEVQLQGASAGTSYGAYVVGNSGGNADVLPISMSGSPPIGSTALDADSYDSIHLVITNITQKYAVPSVCADKSYTVTVRQSTTCPSEEIFGEYSEKTALLRDFRDNVLSNTPEGQEIIRLYYEWSPLIVKAMEEDEEFREEVKEIIDEILPFIRE